MNIFHRTRPVYLSIVCCSLTLALAVVQLVSSTASHLLPATVAGAGQQGGSQSYLLHDLTLSGMVAEEQGVAKTQEYNNVDKQPPQYSSSFSVRKLASLLVYNVDVPRHHNQQYDDKPHSFSGKTAGRKLLLHSANDHHEMSTTTATITANGAAKTSGNPRDPHHDVDESSAFHVDYSGPKTHPPKNN